jgi:hypothetical protein
MTRTYVFSGLSKVQLSTSDEKSTLRFRLTFQSSSKSGIVQFDLSSRHAMAFLSGLQAIQRKHGWRIPHRPPSGKPNLRIVSSDDDE